MQNSGISLQLIKDQIDPIRIHLVLKYLYYYSIKYFFVAFASVSSDENEAFLS